MPVDQQGHWFPPTTVNPADLRTPHSPGYTYRDPIPEPTTQTPGELLIKEYGDRTATKDWADLANPRGVLRKQLQTQRQRRAVLPIGSAGLIGEWPCAVGQLVPVNSSPSVVDPEDNVEFENEDGTLGISVEDILGEKWDCLVGANDIVLKRFRGRDVPFTIEWPGYEEQQSTIHAQPSEIGQQTTRLNLAIQITMAYAAFFEKVEDRCMLPRRVGFYNIALHQGKNAREDSLGVQFMQLHLIRCYNTTKGRFVADLAIF